MKSKTLPTFIKISLDVARKILNEEIKINEVLKGRTILAGEYRVSSETIRKAIALLEKEGVVEVRHGVGIFVLDVIKAELFVEKYKADRSIRQQEDDFRRLMNEKQEIEEKINKSLRDLVDSFKYRSSEAINFFEVSILEGSKVIGQTIAQTLFWKNTGATIVAIVHDDAITVSPGPDAILYADDVLIIVGDNEVVGRTEKFLDEGIGAEQMAKLN